MMDKKEAQERADKLAEQLGPAWKGHERVPDPVTSNPTPMWFTADCGPVHVCPFTPSLMNQFGNFQIWIDGLSELLNPLQNWKERSPVESDPKKLLEYIPKMRALGEGILKRVEAAEKALEARGEKP